MPFKLEDQTRLIFDRNPLQVVVTQFRFPPLFSIEQASGVAAFQEAIREDYPLSEDRHQQVSMMLGPGGASPPVGEQGPWRFFSDDKEWTVALAPDFLSLETTHYERFESFCERAEKLLLAAKDAFHIDRRVRIGLRYVNEFKHPDADSVSDWHKFLQKDLLGIPGGELLQEHVSQSLQQIHLESEEGKLLIRHGYLRPNNEGSVYILDIDAFDDTVGFFDPNEIIASLNIFKVWVWRIFRRSITDELVQYLGPKELVDVVS